MSSFLISYDLHGPHRDYSRIEKGVRALCANAVRVQDSLWRGTYTGSAIALRDGLKPFVDGNDSLYVEPVEGSWAALNLADGVADRLKK